MGLTMRVEHRPGALTPRLWAPDQLLGACGAMRAGKPTYCNLLIAIDVCANSRQRRETHRGCPRRRLGASRETARGSRGPRWAREAGCRRPVHFRRGRGRAEGTVMWMHDGSVCSAAGAGEPVTDGPPAQKGGWRILLGAPGGPGRPKNGVIPPFFNWVVRGRGAKDMHQPPFRTADRARAVPPEPPTAPGRARPHPASPAPADAPGRSRLRPPPVW